MPAPYLPSEPIASCLVAQAPAVPTAVVRRTGFPMYEMPQLMDGVFSQLPRALAEAGIAPIGPAFSLHHRAPVDTADLEVGFPVDGLLAEPIELEGGYTVEASELPAGRVAQVSYVGGYGGLGEAWGRFTQAVGDSDEQMRYPFWEFYVTEPSPDADPATLRTDLASLLEPRG